MQNTLKIWFRSGGWRYLLGAGFGAVLGYGYWYFYGCVNGCTITGSALNSSAYGAFMGYLVAGMFTPQVKKNAESSED